MSTAAQIVEIPYGYCQCGCGQKTAIPKHSISTRGIVKGVPVKFVRFHYSTHVSRQHQEQAMLSYRPTGYCECGCGNKTLINRATWKGRKGMVKGQPMRFMPGHNRWTSTPLWIVNPATNCWIWQRSTDGKYGTLSVVLADGTRKTVKAHRYFYEQKHGPIPDGKVLDHVKDRCISKLCVNPDHVEPVTQIENIRRGSKCRLTQGNVDEMRMLRLQGWSGIKIAKRFGISWTHAYQIINRRAWA